MIERWEQPQSARAFVLADLFDDLVEVIEVIEDEYRPERKRTALCFG